LTVLESWILQDLLTYLPDKSSRSVRSSPLTQTSHVNTLQPVIMRCHPCCRVWMLVTFRRELWEVYWQL